MLFFISCDNNNNDVIASRWNLIQTNGGFSKPKNYDKGTFTWEFDMNQKTITTINNADIFVALYSPSFINNRGGIYSFKIVKENGLDFLVVGNRKAAIELEQNKLTIEYAVAADDIGYIFKR